MPKPVYLVTVKVEIPVLFSGESAEFEQEIEAFNKAAERKVREFLPPILASYAEITLPRFTDSQRYYPNGADYDGRVPTGLPMKAGEL